MVQVLVALIVLVVALPAFAFRVEGEVRGVIPVGPADDYEDLMGAEFLVWSLKVEFDDGRTFDRDGDGTVTAREYNDLHHQLHLGQYGTAEYLADDWSFDITLWGEDGIVGSYTPVVSEYDGFDFNVTPHLWGEGRRRVSRGFVGFEVGPPDPPLDPPFEAMILYFVRDTVSLSWVGGDIFASWTDPLPWVERWYSPDLAHIPAPRLRGRPDWLPPSGDPTTSLIPQASTSPIPEPNTALLIGVGLLGLGLSGRRRGRECAVGGEQGARAAMGSLRCLARVPERGRRVVGRRHLRWQIHVMACVLVAWVALAVAVPAHAFRVEGVLRGLIAVERSELRDQEALRGVEFVDWSVRVEFDDGRTFDRDGDGVVTELEYNDLHHQLYLGEGRWDEASVDDWSIDITLWGEDGIVGTFAPIRAEDDVFDLQVTQHFWSAGRRGFTMDAGSVDPQLGDLIDSLVVSATPMGSRVLWWGNPRGGASTRLINPLWSAPWIERWYSPDLAHIPAPRLRGQPEWLPTSGDSTTSLIPQASISPIPEPHTALLIGLGLVGLGLSGRRRAR